MVIRKATQGDARHLAQLINMAGESLPEYLWQEEAAVTGMAPLQLGAQRASRGEGGFSYRNACVAENDGNIAGMVLGYRLDESPEALDPESLPACVRPLVELEARAPGTWYVNAVAAFPEYRGRGVGSALMAHCEILALDSGVNALSLIVASENDRAHRLYMHLGFSDIAALPLLSWPGGPRCGDWVLMVRTLDN